MSIILHEPDNHGAFMHRLITTTDGNEFIVCAECGHWTGRPVPVCRCKVSCHAQVRLMRDLFGPHMIESEDNAEEDSAESEEDQS